MCTDQGIVLDQDVLSSFHADAGRLPENEKEKAVDAQLARIAVETSFERHVGKLEVLYGPRERPSCRSVRT